MDPQYGTQQPDLLIGQTIGNYLVTQKLGEGGMGAVYLAEHPSIGKKVALKVLHNEFSTNQEIAARFFNEAKAVNDIGHPNIVDIVDFGIIQAGPNREQLVYFIMEYLGGLTLSQAIRSEAPLPPERALGIALQVADALAASHKCGIVHRDLKPDNIILMQRGRERDFVKLLDFGIAKLTNDQPGSRRTRTGIVMGTPAYMSPEQCEGRGNIDHRTDIYALGIVLYEMLTGRVPFVGEGYGEVLVQHLTQPPVPPSQYRMMNPHLEAVVMKALEKRADLRYPTMDEMMHAMADPVGYVEAHGGIVGFGQRQLMPSAAPLPSSARLTPGPIMVATPLPGSISTVGGYTTPVPTTLGASAGEVRPSGAKKGLLILSGLVVAAAAAAVVVVVSKSGPSVPAVGGSGSQIAETGSGSSTGSAGSAPEPVGSGSQAAGTDPGSNQTAGSGSQTAGTGTGTDSGSGPTPTPTPTPTLPEMAKITLTTKPPGARIFVDGVELPERTPQPFSLPRSSKRVKVVLRLATYEDLEVPLVPEEDRESAFTLKPKKKVPVPPPDPRRGSGSRGSGGRPGPGSSDSDLMRPD
ncbi:MAG TPA: serine/threonine-protein kinase [Kofleriaceae bacterium]|nr:serine/threonine-protein kinase [Kofleriaceae bacterium]